MANRIKHQVFVSSTYDDLIAERQKVYQILLQIDCLPSGMELFPATDDDQFEFIKSVIAESDYYIVIVANRYGSTARDGISYTEKEYLFARDSGIPILAFLHEAPSQIASGFSESNIDSVHKLEKFRTELKSRRIAKFWSNADDLANKISLSVLDAKHRHPRTGWVRGSTAASEQILTELAASNRRAEELRQEVDSYKSRSLDSLDLLFPSVTIDCEFKNGNRKRMVVPLDTVFLTLSYEMSLPLTDEAFKFSMQGFLSKLLGTSSTFHANHYDISRVQSLLFAKGVIDVCLIDNTRAIAITEFGRSVMRKLYESSLKAEISAREENLQREPEFILPSFPNGTP